MVLRWLNRSVQLIVCIGGSFFHEERNSLTGQCAY